MSEMDEWLESVAKNAETIERLQDRLAASPEFVALMTTYRAAPSYMAPDMLRTVANFTVLYLTKK
jgi:hypothetical protein